MANPHPDLRIDFRWEVEPDSADAALVRYLKTHSHQSAKSLMIEATQVYQSLDVLYQQFCNGVLDIKQFQVQVHARVTQMSARIATGCYMAQIDPTSVSVGCTLPQSGAAAPPSPPAVSTTPIKEVKSASNGQSSPSNPPDWLKGMSFAAEFEPLSDEDEE